MAKVGQQARLHVDAMLDLGNDMITNARHFMDRFIVYCAIVALITPLGGCISSVRYPPTWPPLDTSKDVEELVEGSYDCHGTDHAGRNTSLYTFLFTGNARCDHLTVRGKGKDVLEIQLWDKDFPVVDVTYRKGVDFKVVNNWVVLSAKTGYWAEDVLLMWGVSSTVFQLGVDSESNLVVRRSKSEAGMLLIPVAGSERDYCRFQRIR